MPHERVMTPFPAVRIWFVRPRTAYWQTRTDEKDYGDGMAGPGWFDKSMLWEKPVNHGWRMGEQVKRMSRGEAWLWAIGVVAVASALVILLGVYVNTAKAAPAPVVLISGHRGTTVGADENTIAAFQYALPYADILETDVRLTKDKKMVIMHDATLDRTTNCSGAVSGRTLASIKLCKTARGQHPPSLRQFLQWAGGQDRKIGLEVEPKGTWTQYRVQGFVDELTNYDALTDVTASSFSAANLVKVEKANDALPDEKAGLHVETAWIEGGDPTLEPFRVCDRYDQYNNNIVFLKAPYVASLQQVCNPSTVVAAYGKLDSDADYEAVVAVGAKIMTVEDARDARRWRDSR